MAESDLKVLEKLPEHQELNKMLEKYIEGINWWASTHYLPIEFYMLGIRFKEWTLLDSFTHFRLLIFSFALDHPNELLGQLVNDVLGPDYYKLLYRSTLYDFPYFNETIMSAQEIKEMGLEGMNGLPENIANKNNKKLFDLIQPPLLNVSTTSYRDTPLNIEKPNEHASNSWVVHGSKTNTSKPIYSNDPH